MSRINQKKIIKQAKLLRASGKTYEEIADELCLSSQRIHQLISQVQDEAQLKEMAVLREVGWTLARIGKHFDMDKRRVSEWLSQHEFPRRKCIYCGKWFTPTSAIRYYDSIMHKRAMLAAHRRYHKREEANDGNTGND